MKHVQLVIPRWSLTMPWVGQIGDVMKCAGYRFSIASSITQNPDIVIFGWANAETAAEINSKPKSAKYIVFMRRYEFYQEAWERLEWPKVDEMVFVNTEIMKRVRGRVVGGPKMRVLYNGVDLEKWTYRDHAPGRNIAMVGYLNHRKNIPLALQIMEKLPRHYSLHLAGDVQEGDVFAYMDYMAKSLRLKIYWDGHVPAAFMDKWLNDKDFLLCAAVSEGNPNNVIEAMAKGIKPVIHDWPGADDQFPADLLFRTVDEAVKIITEPVYRPIEYRALVERKFSKANYSEELLTIVEGLCKYANAA